MRLCVLDYLCARQFSKRLGGFTRRAGKTDARFAAILCEYFTEDIGTLADRAVEEVATASALTCSDLTSHF
jgi:hypothetical protein